MYRLVVSREFDRCCSRDRGAANDPSCYVRSICSIVCSIPFRAVGPIHSIHPICSVMCTVPFRAVCTVPVVVMLLSGLRLIEVLRLILEALEIRFVLRVDGEYHALLTLTLGFAEFCQSSSSKR
jgi:hypothetical protein